MKNFSLVLSAFFVASLLTACGGGFDITTEDKTPKNTKTPPTYPEPQPYEQPKQDPQYPKQDPQYPKQDPQYPKQDPQYPQPYPQLLPTGEPANINCHLSLNFGAVLEFFPGDTFLFNIADSLKAPLAAVVADVRNGCVIRAGSIGENAAFCDAIVPENVISFGVKVNLGSGHSFICSI